MGPPTMLTKQEEDRLEKWIIDKAKLGFPMHQDDVKDAVQRVLKDMKRPNPFKHDRPGNKWMHLILNKKPTINFFNTNYFQSKSFSHGRRDSRTVFGKE
ncbi:hypothetical protein JTB14_032878 [Gonioctena quinquepunctata]|nr:hypothetical protein JTB14_032878 [Gonioctena quinquepunctata]